MCVEWCELGEGKVGMRLETQGVGTGHEEPYGLGKEFGFSSKWDRTHLYSNIQLPKHTYNLT